MTTLESFGVPLDKSKSSMLQPMLSYRFRVLPLNIGSERSEAFCQQVQVCKLDLSKKTLHVDVRQSVGRDGFDAVAAVVDRCKSLVVDYLTGKDLVAFSLAIAVESVTHELVLDYASSSNLMHRLGFTFSEYETMEGNVAAAKPYPMINTGTDEFITPGQALDLIDGKAKVENKKPKTVKKSDVEREADKD